MGVHVEFPTTVTKEIATKMNSKTTPVSNVETKC